MCLLICIRSADGSLWVAANRDEAYDRPARRPFVWDRRPAVLAGRDERAGGTWLAVNTAGVVAAVTNRPTAGGDEPSRPTRGLLPLLACSADSAGGAREALLEHLGATRHNGFNLFVADARDAFVIESPAGQALPRPVGPGLHAVANGEWDDASDPRVARAMALLSSVPGAADAASTSEALATACRDHAELGGGLSLCLHGRSAGTVSSTILSIDPGGVLGRYLHTAAAPCRTGYVDLADMLA